MTASKEISKDEIAAFMKKMKEAENTDSILEAYAEDIDAMCDVVTLMLAAGKGGKLRVATRRLCKTLGIELAEATKQVEAGNSFWNQTHVEDILRKQAKGKSNKLTKDGVWAKLKSKYPDLQSSEYVNLDKREWDSFVNGSGTQPNEYGIFADGKGRGRGYYTK